MTTDREARRVQFDAMLAAERGDAYAVAFRAAVDVVARFATEQAGTRGMTKAAAQTLRNCLAELAGKARQDAEDGLIPWELGEALRDHALSALNEAEQRLGTRGAP